MRVLAAVLLLAALAVPAMSQSTASPPPFAAGDNVAYCHVTDATNTIWMNTQVDDGDGVPYEIFGEPATTVPVVGLGVDPAANSAFEVRIPLSPALAQKLSIAGTVKVDAFIGGGTATSGTASIGTSLVADGAVLGSAPAKDHSMTPQTEAGTNYNAISWTFDVAGASVPAGAKLEWVLSGTASGNNVFLACHEGRGRSGITLPIASASSGAGGVLEHTLTGATAHLNLSAAAPTNATHHYNWTTALAKQRLTVVADVLAGNATLRIVDGANATLKQVALAGNLTEDLAGAPGNWSITIELAGFRGNVTADIGPVPAPTATSSSSTSGSKSGTGTKSATSTTASGNATGDGGKKDTPGVAAPVAGLAVLAVAVALRRRRA